MRFPSPVFCVVLPLVVLGASACSIGWGTRAPGVTEYMVLEGSGIEYHDSSDRRTGSWGADHGHSWSTYSEGSSSDSALGLGMREGYAQVAVDGMEADSGSLYWEFMGYYRNCRGGSSCLGLDVGWYGQGGSLLRRVPSALNPSQTVDQDVGIDLTGLQISPLLQYGFFDDFLWLEAGAGLDRVTVRQHIGSDITDGDSSEPTWGWHWALGAGLAFESFGLRFGYQRVSVEATIDRTPLDVSAGAWTFELVL